MPAKAKQTVLPVAPVLRRKLAEEYVGGRQVLDDAIREGLLKPVCEPSRKMTFFATTDCQFVAHEILHGRYPGRSTK